MTYFLVIIYMLGAIFTYGFIKGTMIAEFTSVKWNNVSEFILILAALCWTGGLPMLAFLSYRKSKTKNWCLRFRK